MNSLLFPASVTRAADQVQAKLIDFPTLHAHGATDAEVISSLQEQLQTAVLAFVEEKNALPVPTVPPDQAGRTDLLMIPLPPGDGDIKASEKFLDFTKAEFDRVLASSRLAEDRAKQNGVFALAAIPILGFLQSGALSAPGQVMSLRYNVVQVVALVDVIVILVLVGLTLRSRDLKGIGWTPKELDDEQETVLAGYRPYTDELYVLQGAWIKGTTTVRGARDVRFTLVGWQQPLLVLLVVLIASLLVFRSLGW